MPTATSTIAVGSDGGGIDPQLATAVLTDAEGLPTATVTGVPCLLQLLSRLHGGGRDRITGTAAESGGKGLLHLQARVRRGLRSAAAGVGGPDDTGAHAGPERQAAASVARAGEGERRRGRSRSPRPRLAVSADWRAARRHRRRARAVPGRRRRRRPGALLVLLTTALLVCSALLVPLSGEAVALRLHGSCAADNFQGCALTLAVFAAPPALPRRCWP